jgi:hypothetical protein
MKQFAIPYVTLTKFHKISIFSNEHGVTAMANSSYPPMNPPHRSSIEARSSETATNPCTCLSSPNSMAYGHIVVHGLQGERSIFSSMARCGKMVIVHGVPSSLQIVWRGMWRHHTGEQLPSQLDTSYS